MSYKLLNNIKLAFSTTVMAEVTYIVSSPTNTYEMMNYIHIVINIS